MKKGQVIIDVVNGVEGPSLYIGDEDSGHRLAGPKPWGGGSVVFKFIVDVAELQEEAARFGKAPQRTWVGLTPEEVEACIHHVDEDGIGLFDFAEAIEAKLKQKNVYAEEKNT